MRVEKARDLIKDLKKYVVAYENYHPQNVKQEAIKLYAELESVAKVAKELNARGYRKDGKPVAGMVRQIKLESNDVTKMLSNEIDENDKLHAIVKKSLNKKKRRIS